MFPKEMGFQMPPEWGTHSRTIMAWPVKEALWPEPFAAILPAYAAIVNTIARFEPVTLVVKPELAAQAAAFCGFNIELLPLDYNDSWLRDSGPTIMRNRHGELLGLNWIFNAWGGKFPYELDNRVAARVLNHLRLPCLNLPLVMEGGSFHVDGAGTLLTTEECLLDPNRNPALDREAIATWLRRGLNVNKIIWLKHGWDGDDTDGHIDNIACFARPGVIITQVCRDPADPNYVITRENLAVLRAAADAQGNPLTIIEIEQPPVVFYQGARLTLSYINFYFVNGGIVLPVFGGAAAATDAKAIAALKQLFPEREIATVDGLIIARGGGNVHCLTQQVPAAIAPGPEVGS
ncbi:MAG: agmatine deiminase family protein [Bacillota bacterium]|jgi:agmatine deiminase